MNQRDHHITVLIQPYAASKRHIQTITTKNNKNEGLEKDIAFKY